MTPNYLLSQSPDKVVLRNFEGVITSYPEPKNYIPGSADAYFDEVYGTEERKEAVGIAALMTDEKFNLVPEGLRRLDKRKAYESTEEHASLKDRRDKRDEMKEKLMKAQEKKNQPTV